MRRKEAEEKRQLALRKKEEKMGEKLAKKMLQEEERALQAERLRQEKLAKRDMEIAKRMQDEELAEIHENADRVVKNWKEPTVEVEECDGGVLLIVELSECVEWRLIWTKTQILFSSMLLQNQKCMTLYANIMTKSESLRQKARSKGLNSKLI